MNGDNRKMYRIIAKFEGYDVVEHVKMEEYKQAQRDKKRRQQKQDRENTVGAYVGCVLMVVWIFVMWLSYLY